LGLGGGECRPAGRDSSDGGHHRLYAEYVERTLDDRYPAVVERLDADAEEVLTLAVERRRGAVEVLRRPVVAVLRCAADEGDDSAVQVPDRQHDAVAEAVDERPALGTRREAGEFEFVVGEASCPQVLGEAAPARWGVTHFPLVARLEHEAQRSLVDVTAGPSTDRAEELLAVPRGCRGVRLPKPLLARLDRRGRTRDVSTESAANPNRRPLAWDKGLDGCHRVGRRGPQPVDNLARGAEHSAAGRGDDRSRVRPIGLRYLSAPIAFRRLASVRA